MKYPPEARGSGRYASERVLDGVTPEAEAAHREPEYTLCPECSHTLDQPHVVAAPIASRDGEVAAMAAAIIETGFGWPTSLGNPDPPSMPTMARIQAEAILRLLAAARLAAPSAPSSGDLDR